MSFSTRLKVEQASCLFGHKPVVTPRPRVCDNITKRVGKDKITEDL